MEETIKNNNLDEKIDENLFNELLLKEDVSVPPEKFNNKIDIYINEFLKNKIEEKCISEGYIRKDSINILKKSVGLLKGSRFNGDITFKILFKAEVCNPKVGTKINCNVKLVNNKLGILGNNGPLTIIVGRQFHNNPSLLDNINIGDNIEIKIIDSKFSLNDKEIKIIGKLNTDSDLDIKNEEIDDLVNIDSQGINDELNEKDSKYIDNLDIESLDEIDSDLDDDVFDDGDGLDEGDDDIDDIDDIDEIHSIENDNINDLEEDIDENLQDDEDIISENLDEEETYS